MMRNKGLYTWVGLALWLLVAVAPGRAGPRESDLAGLLDRLWVLARMDDNIRITHETVLAQTADMDAQLLGGHGGAGFRRAVEQAFAPDILRRDTRTVLTDALTGHEAALATYLAFLETNAGRRSFDLMRQAGLAVDKAPQRSRALSLGQQRIDEQDPRFLRVMTSPDYLDRLDRFTTHRMAAIRAYYRGFRDSGGLAAGDTAIEAMLADMLPMVRQQVEEERMATMVLWVEDMSLAEVTSVMTYFETPQGDEVLRALEQATQAFSVQNYRDLGLLAGRFVTGSDL
jgi:hypothetical protein